MIRKLKNRLMLLVMAFGLLLPAAIAPVAVYAAEPNIQGSVCGGTDLTVPPPGSTPNCDSNAEAEDSVNNIVKTVINVFSWVVGVISVIFIIFGGFKYITSGGESNQVTAARNTIMYAIVGLVIVALSQIMVQFVLNRVVQT